MINHTVENVKDIYSPSFLETIYTCFIHCSGSGWNRV